MIITGSNLLHANAALGMIIHYVYEFYEGEENVDFDSEE